MSRGQVAALALAACLVTSPSVVARGKRRPAARKVPQSARDRLQVFHDGKGHYIFVGPYLKAISTKVRNQIIRHLYFGTKRAVHHITGGGTYYAKHPNRFSYRILDPRRGATYLRVDGDAAIYHCGTSQASLRKLAPAAAQRLIAKVSFRERYWRREPHLLARNEEGEYFYIDRKLATKRSGGLRFHPRLSALRGFRLWRGRRGRMKRLKLQDVVIDAAGQIFLTKKGALHVTTRKSQRPRRRIRNLYKITSLAWRIRRTNKRSKLTHVPLDDSSTLRLIHRHLGPYTGVKFGLPCDVW